jgi:hypothetical protein
MTLDQARLITVSEIRAGKEKASRVLLAPTGMLSWYEVLVCWITGIKVVTYDE